MSCRGLWPLQVFDLVGPSVQRYLPADLNPKVKEQIEQGMLSRPAPGQQAQHGGGGAGTAAARPQPPKSAAPGKKAGGSPAAARPSGLDAGRGSALPSVAEEGGGLFPPSPGQCSWF